jgi:hypothetical protein
MSLLKNISTEIKENIQNSRQVHMSNAAFILGCLILLVVTIYGSLFVSLVFISYFFYYTYKHDNK